MPSERTLKKLTEEEAARLVEMEAGLPRPSWFHSSSDDEVDDPSIAPEEDDRKVFEGGCCSG